MKLMIEGSSDGGRSYDELIPLSVSSLVSRARSIHHWRSHHVRFAPKADKRAEVSPSRLSANRDLAHCSKKHHYSITSSASASTVGGEIR